MQLICKSTTTPQIHDRWNRMAPLRIPYELNETLAVSDLFCASPAVLRLERVVVRLASCNHHLLRFDLQPCSFRTYGLTQNVATSTHILPITIMSTSALTPPLPRCCRGPSRSHGTHHRMHNVAPCILNIASAPSGQCIADGSLPKLM